VKGSAAVSLAMVISLMVSVLSMNGIEPAFAFQCLNYYPLEEKLASYEVVFAGEYAGTERVQKVDGSMQVVGKITVGQFWKGLSKDDEFVRFHEISLYTQSIFEKATLGQQYLFFSDLDEEYLDTVVSTFPECDGTKPLELAIQELRVLGPGSIANNRTDVPTNYLNEFDLSFPNDYPTFHLTGASVNFNVTAATINPGYSIGVELQNGPGRLLELTIPKTILPHIKNVVGSDELWFRELSSNGTSTTIEIFVPEETESITIYDSYSQFPYPSNPARGELILAEITPSDSPKPFWPDPIFANIHDTVIWINKDSTPHTITSGSDGKPDGRFDSSPNFSRLISPGGNFSYTFEEAGEFPYFCTLHPNMVGAVIVAEGLPRDALDFSPSSEISLSLKNSEGYTPSIVQRGEYYLITISNSIGAPLWENGERIVEVRSEDNITVRLHTNDRYKIIHPNSKYIQIPWVPESAGNYEIRTFLIGSNTSDHPNILTKPDIIKVTVLETNRTDITSYPEVIISLSSYCYYCPFDKVHFVRIYGDGQVFFDIGQFYYVIGPSEEGVFALDNHNFQNTTQSYRVSIDKVREIVDNIEKIDFFNLEGVHNGCDHCEEILVSIWFNGKSRSIADDQGTSELWFIGDKIDQLARSANTPHESFISDTFDDVDYNISFLSYGIVIPVSATFHPDHSVALEFVGEGLVEVTLQKQLIDDILELRTETGKIEHEIIGEDEIFVTISFYVPLEATIITLNPPNI
jgi:plastocyanin